MPTFLSNLGPAANLLMVILGFGFIVFIHEMGHFLAARWAGIRVLAFALGFGPAVLSWRTGWGLRRGSSEPEYLARQATDPDSLAGISPTEYRLNVLPFGGYVKMLGQVDADPSAVSDAPDGYQRCVPWKRMVVISAGVVANVILAGALFIAVYMAGKMEEPSSVGAVRPGSPAASALVFDPSGAPLSPGLRSNDRIRSINDDDIATFNEVVTAVAMSRKDAALAIRFERDGQMLTARATPAPSPEIGLLDLGISPALSPRIKPAARPGDLAEARAELAAIGLPGVEPGARMVRVNADRTIRSAHDLLDAVAKSRGTPVEAEFAGNDGPPVTVVITPRPVLQTELVKVNAKRVLPVDHLLGLVPAMAVGSTQDAARDAGLRPGDIFARLGDTPFPTPAQGVTQVTAKAGQTIRAVVLRPGPDGSFETIDLPAVPVRRDGTIGFGIASGSEQRTLLATPLATLDPARGGGGAAPIPSAAASIPITPGSRITRVNDRRVSTMGELREALREATAEAHARWLDNRAAPGEDRAVVVRLSLMPPDATETQTIDWRLSPRDVADLHALAWTGGPIAEAFDLKRFEHAADGPLDAIRLGLRETKRVMAATYLTFARIAQGSIGVEQLKGPVGIAHLGTMVANQGFIKLLFFLALISVNLAVVNFLPFPIVDGGQFLFIVYEQFRGRPPSILFQNVATLAGLGLIACAFLFVTYNDIRNLFGL